VIKRDVTWLLFEAMLSEAMLFEAAV